MPRPWSAEIANGCPRPRDHSSAASDSPAAPSTLLAASTTGRFERRSSRTSSLSVSTAPTVPSTTRRTASARSTATSACSATRASIPATSTSQPPVSTRVNSRPAHSAG